MRGKRAPASAEPQMPAYALNHEPANWKKAIAP
jgi:hypothetical protein